MSLTPKQQSFVDNYLIDLNATQAAIRAGYSEHTAGSIGHELLGKANVADAIAAAQAKRSEETGITAKMVLERWWSIATANPNELMSYRRACCRHCWGEGFAYQYESEDEFQAACERAVAKDRPLPPSEIGFRPTRPPHPECPKCEGLGMGHAHFEDTRRLSAPALALYAGVKETKDGFEFKVHDQAKALENVARHLGMFIDKSEVEVKGVLSDIGDKELDDEIMREAKKLGLTVSQLVEKLAATED